MNGDEGIRADDLREDAASPPLARELARADYAAAVRPGMVRLPAAALFLSCAAVLGVAIYLKPDPSGMGTHEKLGLQPCGMVVMTGYPCPTCGMTTAFAHTVRGQVLSAIHAQPTGFILAVITILTAAGSLFALVVGRPPRVPWHVLTPYRLMLALLLLTLGGWFAKLAIGRVEGTLPVQVANHRW